MTVDEAKRMLELLVLDYALYGDVRIEQEAINAILVAITILNEVQHDAK